MFTRALHHARYSQALAGDVGALSIHCVVSASLIHSFSNFFNFLSRVVGSRRTKSMITAYSSFSGKPRSSMGDRSNPMAIRKIDSMVIDANPDSIVDKWPFDMPVAAES